jgi:hypothetical protein
MNITALIFEAFLKCPTKCWLRFTSEPPSGNAYAEWVQTENESYRAAAAKRLLANMTESEYAISPAAVNRKTSQWRFAVDVPARTVSRLLPECGIKVMVWSCWIGANVPPWNASPAK